MQMVVNQQQNISWYALERLALRELQTPLKQCVTEACQNNPKWQARRAAIVSDQRPMPPFTPETMPYRPWFAIRRPSFALSFAALGSAILIAGLGYLIMRTAFVPSINSNNGWYEGAKGGKMAVSLVRQRAGVTSHAPDTFLEEDRFRFYVTSPIDSAKPINAEVTVFQGNQIFFPYNRPVKIDGGNLKALPNALQFNGHAPVRICVSTGVDMPSRNRIRKKGPEALPDTTVCVTLRPETK